MSHTVARARCERARPDRFAPPAALSWIFLGTVGLAGVSLSGCSPPAPAAMAPTTPVVRVVDAALAETVDYDYFTGRTEAIEAVDIRARVSGYLTQVCFKPGDEVQTGDLLFKIDPATYQTDMQRAQAQLLQAQARRKLAEANVARANNLASGAISKQEVDRYFADLGESDALIQAAQASIAQAKLNLGYTDVRAPVNGRIGRNLLTVGNLVMQDATVLTTIVSEDPIYAYFDIDERTMLRAQQLARDTKAQHKSDNGLRVRFGLANEKDEYPHEGAIDFTNNRISSSTGTLQVRAVLDNPLPPSGGPRLLTPGLFLRVRVTMGDPHPAIVVPQSAIGTDQARKFLLVVNAKNVVEYRPVEAGPIQPDGRQAVEPLPLVIEADGPRPAREGETGAPSIRPGERVIVTGMQRIRPGVTVETKPY